MVAVRLRPIRSSDHPDVLQLNQANLTAVSSMDPDRLRLLDSLADRAEVIEVEGGFGGFVFTFAPGSAYDSVNYRWFAERYGEEFYYLDRIVVVDELRGQGIGGRVYDQLEAVAAPYGRLTLEVNTIPRNEGSLVFHHRRGFREAGILGDEHHQVSLMSLELR